MKKTQYKANKTFTKNFKGIMHKGGVFTKDMLTCDDPDKFIKQQMEKKKISIIQSAKSDDSKPEVKKSEKSGGNNK